MMSTRLQMLEKYWLKDKLATLRQHNHEKPELKSLIKLTICTQFYPPDYAATGQLIEELAIQLESFGMHVRIFTGQPGYAFHKAFAPKIERSGNLIIERSQATRFWHSRIRGKGINGLLFFIRTILYFLRASNRKDLVLLTTAPPFLPIAGYVANRLFGLPYICLIYDLYPDIAVELKVVSRRHWITRLWNWLNQKVWQRAQQVIVLSSTMKERVQSQCPKIADKITVIHNWADPDWIVPIAKEDSWFACEYDLVKNFTVLYSGNMGRCHDIDTILEAARQLQKEPIKFVFIGDGAKLSTCIEQVNDLGLDNCRFLPYQDKLTLPYSLTACDLSLVSVNPDMEGLVAPSKLYGILASGRPVAVICEPHSYLHKLIADAKCGAVFNNGDGKGLAKFIRLLASDRQLTEQMGNSGRSYLQANFTPEIIAKQYSQLIQQVLVEARQQSKAQVVNK
jgi:glycosyltransferase involved in cell wall biosynthesis